MADTWRGDRETLRLAVVWVLLLCWSLAVVWLDRKVCGRIGIFSFSFSGFWMILFEWSIGVWLMMSDYGRISFLVTDLWFMYFHSRAEIWLDKSSQKWDADCCSSVWCFFYAAVSIRIHRAIFINIVHHLACDSSNPCPVCRKKKVKKNSWENTHIIFLSRSTPFLTPRIKQPRWHIQACVSVFRSFAAKKNKKLKWIQSIYLRTFCFAYNLIF